MTDFHYHNVLHICKWNNTNMLETPPNTLLLRSKILHLLLFPT